MSTPRPWLASYAEGVPHEIELPTGSLYDLVAASVAEFHSGVALEFFGRTTTYTGLGEQIDRAAEGLRVLGVQKGDPVGIVLPNCPQHIVAFYAVLRLGGIVVEHNPLYTPRELRHQFEDHGARVVIAWDKTVATIQAFPADVAVDTIVSVDLTRAMPFSTRALLRLPLARARRSRAALTTRVRGTIQWKKLLESSPIEERIIRAHPVHVRHHGQPQGSGPHPPQPHHERRAGPRLGADRQTWPGLRRVRGAADVSRLRIDPVPHLCDEHGRTAGFVSAL